MIAPQQKIDPVDILGLLSAGASNTAIARYYAANPTLTRLPYTGVSLGYFTGLNRLRSDMNAAAHWYKSGTGGPPTVEMWEAAVSGPWPIETPQQYFNDQAFYFADTGNTEWVRLASSISVAMYGYAGMNGYDFNVVQVPKWSTSVPELLLPIAYKNRVTFRMVVGGDKPVTINCGFYFLFPCIQGGTVHSNVFTSDGTGQIDLCHIDDSAWFPGMPWTKGNAPPNVYANCLVENKVLDPGVYDITFYSDTPAADEIVENSSSSMWVWRPRDDGMGYNRFYYDVVLHSSAACATGKSSWETSIDTYDPTRSSDIDLSSPYAMTMAHSNHAPSGTAFYENSGGIEVAGIHSSARILKIHAPTKNDDAPYPPLFGFVYRDWINIATSAVSPFDAPVFTGDNYIFFSVGYTTSTPGLWLGKIHPAGRLSGPFNNAMPWNVWPLTSTWYDNSGGGGFTGNNNSEYSATTSPWKAQTLYPVGFCVLDPCGFRWRCTVAGFSSMGTADWPTIKTLSPLVATLPDKMTPGFNTFTEGSHRPDNNSALALRTGPTWALDAFNLPAIPRWQPGHTYALGDCVLDKHGNTQELVAVLDATTTPTSATSGISGTQEVYASISMWKTVLGQFTLDPNGVTFTFLNWELKRMNIPTFVAAEACLLSLEFPRYPFIWLDDLNAGQAPRLYPAGTLPNYGWSIGWTPPGAQPKLANWIHRVYLNRIGKTNSAGVSGKWDEADRLEIPVEIGCMRNGTFVSFGTFTTGTMVDAMWPIFTSDFLVYKASERVDLQAPMVGLMAATSEGTTWGIPQIYTPRPMCAYYLTDLAALLPKMV